MPRERGARGEKTTERRRTLTHTHTVRCVCSSTRLHRPLQLQPQPIERSLFAMSSSASGSGAGAAAASSRPSATKLAYKNVVKGKLSLKGGAAKAPVVSGKTGAVVTPAARKRKKEESAEEVREWEARELERLLANKEAQEARAAADAKASAAPTDDPAGEAAAKQAQLDELDLDQSLTKSERDFQRAQKQRELDLIKKKISKTHRQRVEVSSNSSSHRTNTASDTAPPTRRRRRRRGRNSVIARKLELDADTCWVLLPCCLVCTGVQCVSGQPQRTQRYPASRTRLNACRERKTVRCRSQATRLFDIQTVPLKPHTFVLHLQTSPFFELTNANAGWQA